MTCTNPGCRVSMDYAGLCQSCRETRRRLLKRECVWCGQALQEDDGARCVTCAASAGKYGPAMSRLVARYQNMRSKDRLRGVA